ncbi:MAG: TetR-like C-terminal domain-containing protein [Corynebacterium sp.]|nr:TetR-like C-terminal domain-containing protein [Corynebacterium sp.]
MNRNSLRTREALTASLKKQLISIPLNKITVSSLVEDAGITRQAFYYHFHDIYELVEWVFTNEVAEHILTHASLAEWYHGLEMLLDYFQRNRVQVLSVIESLDYQNLERFFYDSFSQMMHAVVDDVIEAGKDSIPALANVRSADKAFVIQHFTAAVVGHTSYWINDGMKDDPHALVARMQRIMTGQVAESLIRLYDFNIPRNSAH